MGQRMDPALEAVVSTDEEMKAELERLKAGNAALKAPGAVAQAARHGRRYPAVHQGAREPAQEGMSDGQDWAARESEHLPRSEVLHRAHRAALRAPLRRTPASAGGPW